MGGLGNHVPTVGFACLSWGQCQGPFQSEHLEENLTSRWYFKMTSCQRIEVQCLSGSLDTPDGVRLLRGIVAEKAILELGGQDVRRRKGPKEPMQAKLFSTTEARETLGSRNNRAQVSRGLAHPGACVHSGTEWPKDEFSERIPVAEGLLTVAGYQEV